MGFFGESLTWDPGSKEPANTTTTSLRKSELRCKRFIRWEVGLPFRTRGYPVADNWPSEELDQGCERCRNLIWRLPDGAGLGMTVRGRLNIFSYVKNPPGVGTVFCFQCTVLYRRQWGRQIWVQSKERCFQLSCEFSITGRVYLCRGFKKSISWTKAEIQCWQWKGDLSEGCKQTVHSGIQCGWPDKHSLSLSHSRFRTR